MLQNTFCHIPGIGPKTEQRLWALGVHSWQTVAESRSLPLSPGWEKRVRRHVEESLACLANSDAGYFYQRLPSGQHWRMFPEFRHSVAYLDIETTGLGGDEDYITTISVYDSSAIRYYVHDDNLLDFRDDIDQYCLLVTYNGKAFDLPFIRNYLRVPMDQPHIDLRYLLHSLGYRGGLKGCEKQLGLDRGDLEGVDGFFAVLLWFDFYNHGNQRALETLLAYNVQDVVSLETLMVLAYNLKVKQTPFFASRCLPMPNQPEIPFEADLETIERIKRKLGWFD